MSLTVFLSSLKVRRWWSIRTMYSIMFLTNFTFTSMFTNLYPYLKTLNQDVTDVFYSWAVAVFPLGIFISSPFLGYWFNCCSVRQPLVFALTLLTLLDIFYSYSSLFPPNIAIWVVLVVRLLMGVSCGSKAAIHAYITAATTVKERTGILSTLTSIIPLAYILGPALGLLFQPLGYPGYTVPYIRLPVSIYTGPILLSALTSLIILISLIWFKEFLIVPRKVSASNYIPSDESNPLICDRIEETPVINEPPYDHLALASMVVASFVSHLFVATIDSLITPYSMAEFAWTKETAVFYNNIIFVGCGFAAFVSIRSISILGKFMQERVIYIISLFVLGVAIFSFIPWPRPGESLHLLLNIPSHNASGLNLVGCDYVKQPWCLTDLKLRKFQIFLAPFLFCLSFPLTYLTVVTITSKIMGPHPSGLPMGLLGASAGLGRSLGLVLFVPLYSKFGPLFTFTTMDLMDIALILMGVVMFYRLVAYGNPRRCV